jgi:hypothetical protein
MDYFPTINYYLSTFPTLFPPSFTISHFINTYRAYIIARTSGIVVADRAPPCGGIARPKAPAIYGATIYSSTATAWRCSVCPSLTVQQELNATINE